MTAVVTLTTKKTPQESNGHAVGIGVAQVSSVVPQPRDALNSAITDVTSAGAVFSIGDTFANVVSALNA